MSNARPFIIWTLQRTGGTNLAKRLFERSRLLESAKTGTHAGSPAAHWLQGADDQWRFHEPFNCGEQGRLFGEVTAAWIENSDLNSLERATDEICSLKLPMKHCVEMVPLEISLALADAAVKYDYCHLFLYRKQSLNRLLSLHYAKSSGVWGAHFKKQDLKDKVFADPLPVAELVEHEALCNQRLNEVWQHLDSRGAGIYTLAFEDIYGAPDPANAIAAITPFVVHAHMSHGEEEDSDFVAGTIGTGEQGTRDDYALFRRVQDLEAALLDVELFRPGTGLSPVDVEPLFGANSRVRFATIDVLPSLCGIGRKFRLEGVLVLNEGVSPHSRLEMTMGDDVREIGWGVDSPGMGRRFSECPNASSARFKIGGVAFDDTAHMEIRMNDGAGHIVPLFGLKLRGSEI